MLAVEVVCTRAGTREDDYRALSPPPPQKKKTCLAVSLKQSNLFI